MNQRFRLTGRIIVFLLAFVLCTACGGRAADSAYEPSTADFASIMIQENTSASVVQTTASAETEAVTEKATKAEKATEQKTIAENATEKATEKETKTEALTVQETTTEEQTTEAYVWHEFASKKLFEDHYEKHVVVQQEFGDITKEQYLQMANDLLNATGDNILTKTEDDGDLLFYNVDTNEFAVMRPDGVIRSYFKPSAGIAYWNRQ